MHELNDDNENMTGLDRVRRQIDRALNRHDPLEVEREKQVELRNIFEQIGLELKYGLRDIASEESQEVNAPSLAEMTELIGFDHNLENISLENNEEVDNLSIVDRLIEIKTLLNKQENAYQEKKRSREIRNRAIAEYIVLGCMWAAGAITMFIVLRV